MPFGFLRVLLAVTLEEFPVWKKVELINGVSNRTPQIRGATIKSRIEVGGSNLFMRANDIFVKSAVNKTFVFYVDMLTRQSEKNYTCKGFFLSHPTIFYDY